MLILTYLNKFSFPLISNQRAGGNVSEFGQIPPPLCGYGKVGQWELMIYLWTHIIANCNCCCMDLTSLCLKSFDTDDNLIFLTEFPQKHELS